MSSNVLPFTGRPGGDAPDRATPGTVTRAVYTIAEVAAQLDLSTGSVYALVRKGDIPAMKLGGRWVIPIRRFQTWLDTHTIPARDLSDAEHAEMLESLAADRAQHQANRHGA